MTVHELARAIEPKISYDADQVSPEVTCPHCEKIVRPRVLNHWIDHKATLAFEIAKALGLNVAPVRGAILDLLNRDLGYHVTGDPKVDAPVIAEAVLRVVR